MLVYHYTYSNNILSILNTGVLLPPCLTPTYLDAAAEGITDKRMVKEHQADSRLLLFSERTDWEPASYRAIGPDLQHSKPLRTLEEHVQHGIDVYRIAADSNLLLPYLKLLRRVRMPPEMARSLADIARELGSDPYQWWGTTEAVESGDWESVEVYDPKAKLWVPLP